MHTKESLMKDLANMGLTGKETIMVHGHIPTTLEKAKSMGAIPGKIWIQERDINVDCGLVYGVAKSKGLYGDLAAFCLEEHQVFYYYNHKVNKNGLKGERKWNLFFHYGILLQLL